MSYDIYLRDKRPPCSECKRPYCEEPDSLNPTYNLTPIFDFALTGEPLPNVAVSEAAVVLFREKTDRPRGLRLLSARVAKDTRGMIDAALARLNDPALHDDFVKLEPANKWGTLSDALWIFRQLRAWTDTYPDNTWEIH